MDNIREITIEDKNYPAILKKIDNPPKKLYIKGEIKNNELCFAIVGTRNCSDYGKQVTLDISRNLSKNGLTIVSGLAPGIDTFAHRAVVEQKRRTIAVLGTGIDEESIYPKENIILARKIIEFGGCIISEYPPKTKGNKFNFPNRNRIISGLSLGVLVVEAKEKSGSLITANFALKQNKKLFAIPGPIYSINSKGTNGLIKKGAKLVEDFRDILEELKIPIREDNIIEKGENEEEDLILKILEEQPSDIDKIIEKSKLPPEKAIRIIMNLELKEKIKNLGGNIYALIR